MKFTTQEELKEVFSLYSRGLDGYLSMEESREALVSIKEKPLGNEFGEFFLDLSLDGEGHIDFYEFLNLVEFCKD